MKAGKLVGRFALFITIVSAAAYYYLAYFLPFQLSLAQISEILLIISAVLSISLITYLSARRRLHFIKFEKEMTLLFIVMGLFYALGFIYTDRVIGSFFSLQTRRTLFIAVDLLYAILASVLLYLFVIYFIPKATQFQKYLFYIIVFIFIISLDIPFLKVLVYVAVIVFFLKTPWLITLSHRYRKTLLFFLTLFWIICIAYPSNFLDSYELFPRAPRLMIGTDFQILFNRSILLFMAVFTVKLAFSLIETSRTLRSKNLLAYFLTSLIPVTIMLLLFIGSYINIAIYFKSYILEDKFIGKVERFNQQFLNQKSFINWIMYSPSLDELRERITLDRYASYFESEFEVRPHFLLQFNRWNKINIITSSSFPRFLNPRSPTPMWYYSADSLPTSSGIKEILNRLFAKKIKEADRLFIRSGNEIYLFVVNRYEDENASIQLALFLPITDEMAESLMSEFGITVIEGEMPPELDTDLLTSSFHIRDYNTGEPIGSVRFRYFDSFYQILFGVLTGSHSLNHFLKGLRDLLFTVLIVFVLIISLLSIFARFINKGMRLSLQKIIIGMRRIGEGNLNYKIELRSRDEYYRLANSINDMTEDLKNYMEDRVEKEKLKGEVDTAYKIQRSILPEKDPDIEGLDISSYINPAEEVGGDFYDFIDNGKGRLGVVIGDVSGHGVSAGMLMAMAKSCIYNQIQHSTNVVNVMDAMNKMVFDTVHKRLLMTFLYAIVDIKKNTMHYSNAGHHYAYLYKPEEGILENLKYPSYPLGVRKNVKFLKKSANFNKGDFLVFYSDGIIEQTNRKMELFGFDRFEETILKSDVNTAEELKNAILKSMAEFAEGMEIVDDITLIVIKIQ